MRSDSLCPIGQMGSQDISQVGKIVKDLSGSWCFCLFGAGIKAEKGEGAGFVIHDVEPHPHQWCQWCDRKGSGGSW